MMSPRPQEQASVHLELGDGLRRWGGMGHLVRPHFMADELVLELVGYIQRVAMRTPHRALRCEGRRLRRSSAFHLSAD